MPAPEWFEVTPAALTDAYTACIYGDPVKRLRRMASRAARFTHERGNWRFHDFVLHIDGASILGVSRLEKPSTN